MRPINNPITYALKVSLQNHYVFIIFLLFKYLKQCVEYQKTNEGILQLGNFLSACL